MRLLRRLSITARITLGSLLVAALFVTAGAVVVRIDVQAILHSATVTLLTHDAAPYVVAIQQHPGAPLDAPGQGQLIAVVDPSGRTRQSTLPHRLRERLAGILGAPAEVRLVSADSDDYLVRSHPVQTSAGTWYVVTARNEEASDLVLDGVEKTLAIGALVLILGFGVASWLLAMLALRPVSRMRRQAEAIAEEGSADLLPVGPAEDELSALAATLNALIGQLRASAEREKQMVSDASHELRTPIAVLQSQLELAHLSRGDEGALLAEIRSAQATVRRLGQLAANLLELSRIESAPANGSAEWDELVAELADAIDRARLLSAAKDVSIDFEHSPVGGGGADGVGADGVGADGVGGGEMSGETVALSAHSFGRILDNLLGNAGGAVSPGGWVSARIERSRDRLLVVVADSGVGMPAEFLPIALGRFTRSDESRSSHSGGGLGLAIVDALVASAGGRIELVNAPGAGLRVQIELPWSTPPIR